MADDLNDIGSYNIFQFSPNFMSAPDTRITLLRELKEYAGGIKEIATIESKTPYRVSGNFDFDNEDDIYDIFDFFYNRKGRLSKFWFKHPKNAFELKEDIIISDNKMVCYPNFSHFVYEGHERIYIDLLNGDTITWNIIGIVYDDAEDEEEVIISGTWDRDITPNEINNIGRLILCRFDDDTLRIDCSSSEFLRIKLSFYELVEEYSLI